MEIQIDVKGGQVTAVRSDTPGVNVILRDYDKDENDPYTIRFAAICEGEEKSVRFKKPEPDQVTEYAKSIGALIDGQKFCDYYQSRGWKVGKSPMKDWKAAVRTWARNDKKRSGQSFTSL